MCFIRRKVFLAVAASLALACSSGSDEANPDDARSDTTEAENDAVVADDADAAEDDDAGDIDDGDGDDAEDPEDGGDDTDEPPEVTWTPGEPTAIPGDATTFAIGPEGPCGEPVAIDGKGLRRHPYIQSVFPTHARIAWTDVSGETGSVRFSIAGSDEWAVAQAEARHFPVTETFEEVAYNAYVATLHGLEADSDVCYEVFDGDELLVARGSFHTAWTSHDKPIELIAVGDSGNNSDAQRALRDRMLEVDRDIFLHLGDMAYGDGTYAEFHEKMFGVYAPLMQTIPMWPTPGNHEYKTGVATPYIAVYYLPEQAWRADDHEYYYSFDYGNVHFVSIDSNEFRYFTTFGFVDDDMLDWLRDDLANSDADWKIAFMHHPVYSSGRHGNTRWLHEAIVPIIEEGGVDLVLVGHDHHYERTREIIAGEVAEDDPFAITYIVAGAGGAGLREAPGDWFTASVDDERHNFLHLSIDGCTATGTAIDTDGDPVDTFTLNGCEP